ncbi:two-component system regulatory protein YycI [Peribacillus huizhouensis]|uniref:Regulatory protein YycI of two-component signal transduction system YycFG n=1 Tax=Peribacillus huizhouensis TaxID=1501239 RepID=A0ABR6CSP8_9BACI|nr:two-component system regulatory protein YycI [Peribacillus huizhouensis]MBA9028054.1 regulatory protein YycI of two-component signal transduction system YycFG [Peribacillus huizhouensis]
MDWNRTKTIFIMVFLILDIFLLDQFMGKKSDNKYDYMAQASIDELLKEENIEYTPMTKQKQKENYLVAKTKVFKKDDLKSLKDQEITIVDVDRTKVVGTFKTKTKISEKLQSSEIDLFVKENIYHGEDYRYWTHDKTSNSIIYYQAFNSKLFYNNSKGKVTLFLNENKEITSYEQTYLEDIEEFNEPKEMIPPIKAIEALYLKGDIPPDSKITAKHGYYNSLQSNSSSSSFLLVPTWRIVVDDKKDLFVNAFDGEVIEMNTEDKILME